VDIKELYDAHPYRSLAHAGTYPPLVAVSLRALGFTPPDPVRPRVLDIGCGDGLNPLAIAAALPDSRCVGLDLSPVQIAYGEARRAAAGLANCELIAGDLTTLPADGPKFDYIIAHGLYSWVPAPVGDALLRLIAARLAPGGVALVSHDTAPLGYLKVGLRALLLPLLSGEDDPARRRRACVGLLKALAAEQHGDPTLKPFVSHLAAVYAEGDVDFALHDILSEHYRVVPVLELEHAANAAGLKVLGDPVPRYCLNERIGEGQARLEALADGDPGMLLAIRDQIYARTFRTTLLTRADAPPPPLAGDAFDGVYFAGKSSAEPAPPDNPALQIRTTGDATVRTTDAEYIAVVDAITAAWPKELTIADVAAAADVSVAAAHRCCTLSWAQGMVDAYATPSRHAVTLSERPRAAALARITAAERGEGQCINLRLETAFMRDPLAQTFLRLLDGAHTQLDLATEMARITGTPPDPARVTEGLARVRDMKLLEA
jgi:SAM-dependent methyltransferase